MKHLHRAQSIVVVSVKENTILNGLIVFLYLLTSHLTIAIPVSTSFQPTRAAFTVPALASKNRAIASVYSPVKFLARAQTIPTISIQDNATVAVDVMHVSIININGSSALEINGAPISSISVSPVGPNPSEAPSLDVVLSKGYNATGFAPSTTNFIVTSKLVESTVATASMGATRETSPTSDRVVFVFIGLAALTLLTGMLSSRVITIWPHRHYIFASGAHALRWVALLIPVFGLFFVIASMLLINIWDVNTPPRCRAAVMMCITFYFGVKLFEYIFMIERAHQLQRTRLMAHCDDRWYLVEIAGLLLGFLTIGAVAFFQPDTLVSPADGLCRIGLPRGTAITLISFDVLLNTVLTSHYCVMAWRVIPCKSSREALKCIKAAIPFRAFEATNHDKQTLRKLQIGRAVLGLILIIIPTTANLAFLVYFHGHEQGWLCFTACTLDVTWGVIVIHWLTSNPSCSFHTARRWPG